VRANGNAGINPFYTMYATKANGVRLKGVQLHSNPSRNLAWSTKSVALTMPEGTVYCVIMVTGGDWTPDGGIEIDNTTMNGITDADGYGVEDEFDDYPNDDDKAFDYKLKQILNADNKMVGLDVDYKFKASGALFKNGFGFQMDLDPSLLASVRGASLEKGIITTMGNGTEAGQEKATIIITDNVLPYSGCGTGKNTIQGAPYVEPVSVSISILFIAPVTIAQTGYAPYNPFMIIN
jgi:hypothetical protein